MPNRKYPKETQEKAKNEFRIIFSKNPTKVRWAAVREVAPNYPDVAQTSLARWAWDVKREMNLARKGSQHVLDDLHGKLIIQTKQKFESQGYKVQIEENLIRHFIEERGSSGHPDLLAIKGNDIVLIEIVDRGKTQDKIIDQLERYRKVGNVVIVLPMNTANIEFWGLQNL